MKDRRKSKKKRRGMLVLYLVVCTAVIVIAYFHLTKIAKDYNTEHLELISGLYAEKMNETIDYLQSYAKENVKTVRNIEEKKPEEILARLERDLDQTVFCDIGFFMKDGEIYGGACAVADLKKNGLDKQVKKAEELLKTFKLKENERYSYKVITPTAAEKLYKAGRIGQRQWPKLEQIITRSEPAPVVAPESDKRPAWTPTAQPTDFQPVN